MKGDALYWSLTRGLDWLVWGGELLNPENLPVERPVVFVSNHAAALGPVAVACSLSVRVYPWVMSDMLDREKAPDYLRQDFIEPQLHFTPPVSLKLAALLSKISVPLLRSLECIPVRRGEDVRETYRLSLDVLMQGKSLLVFPEDPKQKMNKLYMMTPFQKGFTRLGEMYYQNTKKILRFYPLAVRPAVRKTNVGKPISYNPYSPAVRERLRIRDVLESSIHDLYLSIVFEGYAGIPLLH